jgi:hypothetical protein
VTKRRKKEHITETKQVHSIAINIYNFILYNHSTRYKMLQHYLPLPLLHTGQRGVATIFKRLLNNERELIGGSRVNI